MSDDWIDPGEVDTNPEKWLFAYAAYGWEKTTGLHALMAMMLVRELMGGHDLPDAAIDALFGVEGAWDVILMHAAGERPNIDTLTPMAIEAAGQLLAHVDAKHPSLPQGYEVPLRILFRAVVEGHRINEMNEQGSQGELMQRQPRTRPARKRPAGPEIWHNAFAALDSIDALRRHSTGRP